MTAENYHLKWDSHASYLNSSVATLYKNEKYADVVLYSSSSTGAVSPTIPTVGISAHKFILSSCSHYFAAIFENSPVVNNGPIHIVLPPDLSHRAIQILVQYMYMGEATVSNDILNEVLKGGEILKIRGLCRANNAPAATNVNQAVAQNGGAQQASYNLTRMPPLTTTAGTPVRYLVEQPTSQQPVISRSLIASVLPKDSPVIIKTAKPLSTLAAASSSTVAVMGKLTTTNPIGVNKHVATTDASDSKCCFTHESAVVPPSSTTTTNVREEVCQEVGCNGCQRITTKQQHPSIIMPRDRAELSAEPTKVICVKPCAADGHNRTAEYVSQLGSECVEEDPSLMYEHEMELTTTTMPSDQQQHHQQQQHQESMHTYVASTQSYSYAAHAHHLTRPNQTVLVETDIQHLVTTSPTSSSSLHEPMTASKFVSIKEEPTEWLPPPPPSSSAIMEAAKKNISHMNDFKVQNIKSEPPPSSTSFVTTSSTSSLPLSHEIENQNGQHQMAHAGSRIVTKDFDRFFSCDICKKKCEDKAALLRHLESHSNAPSTSGFNSSTADATTAASTSTSVVTKSYVPKKRRRTSQQENSTDHVCLQCDLCSTRFDTPAEWVRHMSSQHTDVELAIFNSRNEPDKTKSNYPSTSSSNTNNNKKHASTIQTQQQQHLPHQRVQALGGSTNSNSNSNSNLPSNSSTSVLCTSNQDLVNDTSANDNLRSTLSPA